MFFILSKTLDFILLPTVWLLLLLLAALRARPTSRWRTRWLWAAVAFVVIGGNNILVDKALTLWEMPAVPLAAVAPADAAVLLTGITTGSKYPRDRVYLSQGADRFTNTLWLYRAGRVRRIIISGGSGALLPEAGATTEAAALSTLLRLAGVPAQDILLEERSRNTRENALFTKQLLTQHPDLKSLIIVTSAFHERRAMACFTKAGLAAVPFPADFRSPGRLPDPSYWLLPSSEALTRWSTLLHEMAGYLVYKMAGYC